MLEHSDSSCLAAGLVHGSELSGESHDVRKDHDRERPGRERQSHRMRLRRFRIVIAPAKARAVGRLAAVFMILTSVALSLLFAGSQIGEKVAGFRLADTGGKVHDLEEYAGKILVLEFWSFKCPVSLAYDERLAALQAKYRSRGVSVLAVASNKNESPTEVRRNAENLKLPFPVLLDQDGLLADRLGATHTPSVAMLDGGGVLRYRGAVDNDKRAGERGRIPYAEEALNALLAGQPVPVAETKVFGCGIRR